LKKFSLKLVLNLVKKKISKKQQAEMKVNSDEKGLRKNPPFCLHCGWEIQSENKYRKRRSDYIS